jgi:hypothetical protein
MSSSALETANMFLTHMWENSVGALGCGSEARGIWASAGDVTARNWG